jgi:bloom syndrome protein
MNKLFHLNINHASFILPHSFLTRNRRTDSGVIYCLSRKDCENLSDKLNQKLREKGFREIRVSFYHADLDPHEKSRRHREWSLGRISVLCATIAFGMGIDKPDVRYVMHYSMPKSITHYYQVSTLRILKQLFSANRNL